MVGIVAYGGYVPRLRLNLPPLLRVLRLQRRPNGKCHRDAQSENNQVAAEFRQSAFHHRETG